MMATKSTSRGWKRRAQVRQLSALGVAALLATGCAGGSGSSGFISEAAVIQSVIDENRCRDLDGLLVCPAGSEEQIDPTQIPTATPTETPTPGVEATLSPPVQTPTDAPPTPTFTATATADASPTATHTTVPERGIDVLMTPAFFENCDSFEIDGVCLVLQLVTQGFDENARFYLAVRRAGSDDPWDILAAPVNADHLGQPGADAVVPVPVGTPSNSADDNALQIVVLAFSSDPGFVPARVDRLADTGADLAFAVAPIAFETTP